MVTESAAAVRNAVQCYNVIHSEREKATAQTPKDFFFFERVDRIEGFLHGSESE